MKEPTGADGTSGTRKTGVNAIARPGTGAFGTKERSADTQTYLQSCRTEFWQKVFRA